MSERRFTFVSTEDTKTHRKGVRFTTYAQTEQVALNKLKSQFPGTIFKLIDVGERHA